jgi:hypothetical protein
VPLEKYDDVKPEDLEMVRVPRQSRITVKHVPSGEVAETPVAPGSHVEVRFRRPTGIPKDRRVTNMEGYIEPVTDEANSQLWMITTGDDGKNEYLKALAADPAALKASFEGGAKKASKGKPDKPTEQQDSGASADSTEPEPAPEAAAANIVNDETPPAETPPAVRQELDDLLANLQ